MSGLKTIWTWLRKLEICCINKQNHERESGCEGGEADGLTVRIQQSGDPQLSLCDAEGLLQVLLVASGSGFGQIHQVGPQSVQDGQEDHATPPASFEVFHT